MNADTVMAMVVGATLMAIGMAIGISWPDQKADCPTVVTNPWFPVEGQEGQYVRSFVESGCWTDDLAGQYQAELDILSGGGTAQYPTRSMDGELVYVRIE